ncbi:histone deacetylase family protein [Pseudomarimonas arenosa]|uniref:Histone deacetylase n=1 Tax=Pseudomarimonas arenosa TaxID=2774145 RepID=A0AAW3ZFP4_9GAMM|nr:histone deacetylase [Pseudomarimonas arenosa]MBD8524973.1 histone deacetylase [Pseudomarimonas arenosa]
MRAFYCHHFELPLPEGHRFPMAKYGRLFARVQEARQRLGVELCEPSPISREDLQRVHCPDYVGRVFDGRLSEAEQRRIGFPWSPAMVERSRRSVGGTVEALCAALSDGIAVNLAGGTHHAGFARGAGFCVFNDAVVALRAAQHRGLLQRALIVDLDVHQGDGSAALCAADPTIYTLSIHGQRNYPAVKPASDLDIGLPDGTSDAAYLDCLARALPVAIEAARPDAVVYLAGADPFVGDKLGFLALSKAGLAERDRQVIGQAGSRGLPLAICMAGGYAEQVDDIVDIHFATVQAAARAAADSPARLLA